MGRELGFKGRVGVNWAKGGGMGFANLRALNLPASGGSEEMASVGDREEPVCPGYSQKVRDELGGGQDWPGWTLWQGRCSASRMISWSWCLRVDALHLSPEHCVLCALLWSAYHCRPSLGTAHFRNSPNGPSPTHNSLVPPPGTPSALCLHLVPSSLH